MTQTSSQTLALLPAVDVAGGQAVRLVQGAAGTETSYGDPLTAALAWQEADGLVVPGVGAFAACMAGLRAVGGDQVIAKRLAGGRPVLGICVGMQVLFEAGVEHGQRTAGCGVLAGVVERLDAPILPHMGWNEVRPAGDSALLAGLRADEMFYFVHSYAVRRPPPGAGEPGGPVLTWARHGEPFVAAIEDGPLAATQFHPEKSGDAGAALLANWLRTIR